MWKLEFSKDSILFLQSLDQDSRQQIGKALNRFLFELNNPEQSKLSDIKALKGKKGQFRLRVGNFRVRFIKNNTILIVTVIRVGYRRDIYQD